MNQPTIIHFPEYEELFNKAFLPLVDDTSRVIILYGGRGSSKSSFAAAAKVILPTLREKYFKAVCIRKSYNTISASCYETLKSTIEEWGLSSLFKFYTSPHRIVCINGNQILFRGLDEPTKLKSIKDPTMIWWEEDIPDEADYITISLSLRSMKARFVQEVFSINPEVQGDYKDHWFWKRFFEGSLEKSFRFVDEIEIPEKNEYVKRTVVVHHSTYRNNRFLTPEYVADLLSLRERNPYYATVYLDGLWGKRNVDGLAYRMFDRAKSVCRAEYDPKKPLHISFDFNTKPYVTITVHQAESKHIQQIDEVLGYYPNNRTESVCRQFLIQYGHHQGMVYVYGDPSGRKEDTRTEQGQNDFAIIEKTLKPLRPVMRQAKVAPNPAMRINFINAIWQGVIGARFTISETCNMTIDEYMNVKEAKDGGKHKEKVKDKATGVSFEPYGHISDANDYFICEYLWDEYQTFIRAGNVQAPKVGRNRPKNGW
jgi:PBSX family phage terminase large subunit